MGLIESGIKFLPPSRDRGFMLAYYQRCWIGIPLAFEPKFQGTSSGKEICLPKHYKGVIDPNSVSNKVLVRLCNEFDIPYYWVTGEKSPPQKNRVSRRADERKRKLDSITSKTFRAFIKYLDPQTRLIAEILWLMNRYLKNGTYLGEKEVLRLRATEMRAGQPCEYPGMLQFTKKTKNRCVYFSMGVPKYIWSRLSEKSLLTPWYVFCNSRGAPLTPQHIARKFRKASKKALKEGIISKEITPLNVRPVWKKTNKVNVPMEDISSFEISDHQWKQLQSFLPRVYRNAGSKPQYEQRKMAEAILYKTVTRCPWRKLPLEFPPYTAIENIYRKWKCNGFLSKIFELPQARSLCNPMS